MCDPERKPLILRCASQVGKT